MVKWLVLTKFKIIWVFAVKITHWQSKMTPFYIEFLKKNLEENSSKESIFLLQRI
jgi:hypothetical protein